MEELIQVAKEALSQSETFGHFGPLVGLIASAALTAGTLLQVLAGKYGFFPDVPERPLWLRLQAGVAIVGLLFLTAVENGPDVAGFDFRAVALYSLAGFATGVVLYLLWARHLVVRTDGWPEARNIIAGPWLTKAAREYHERSGGSLSDTLASFGNRPEYVEDVWPRASLNVGVVVMFLATFGMNVGLAGTVAALAFDMLDIRIEREESADGDTRTIRFPSHFVFATGASALAEMDTSALEAELDDIGEFGPSRIEVHGHADGQGDDADNQRLSEDRANAVKAWLEAQPQLDGIPVTARGFGETRPRFDETDLAGDALRDARRGNRRVEVVLFRE